MWGADASELNLLRFDNGLIKQSSKASQGSPVLLCWPKNMHWTKFCNARSNGDCHASSQILSVSHQITCTLHKLIDILTLQPMFGLSSKLS
jgi:hypothetical protein